jgi:hypothetical protein
MFISTKLVKITDNRVLNEGDTVSMEKLMGLMKKQSLNYLHRNSCFAVSFV